MTAYELADYMDNNIDAWHATEQKHLDNAATMLRQQADRIAELEKDFAWAKDQWNKDRICFESRRNELEKDLALKTRDRDVFGDFTLAYEKRIAELEETINACYTVQKMQAEEVYKGNDRIAELEKELKRTKFAWNLAENEIERLSNKDKSGNSISAEEYQKTHEGFSTIEKVIAKHEAIPSRKEAIDKAREWLKDYRVEAVFDTPQTKPLSDEEIIKIFNKIWVAGGNTNGVMHRFARAIEERHGIKNV